MKITLKHEKSIILYPLCDMIFTNITWNVDMSKENLIQKLKHSVLTQKDVLIYINAHQNSKLNFDVGNL